MLILPKCVTRCLSPLSPLLSKVPALSRLFAVGFTLLLLTAHAYAAEVILAWDDPHNNPAEVGGYNLYYWQYNWDVPAHVDVGKQTTYTLTDLEAGLTYYTAVTAHDGNGGGESEYSNVVYTAGTVFAVNAGGPAYVDTAGIHYEPDMLFSGGSTLTSTAPIAGTQDDVLYQSARQGNFAYTTPLSNGDYVVTLRFAELTKLKPGRRVFDVLIEGQEVVHKLDLAAKVGLKVAYDMAIPVRVVDGVLNIRFRPDPNNAIVSAIVVQTLGY